MIHRKQIEEVIEKLKQDKDFFEREITQDGKIYRRERDGEMDRVHFQASAKMATKAITLLQKLLDKEQVGGVP